MERPYVNYKEKMLGKKIDFDKEYGYQCTDLFKDYCLKVLGYIFKKSGHGREIRTNKYKIFDSKREKIPGTKNLMQGDIICGTKGTYGHVAIVDHRSEGKVYVLEQNGSGKNSGSGTGDNAIRVQGYDPKFFAGVWRCMKIFENLQAERKYIDEKLKERNEMVTITENYKKSIRYFIS